MQQPKEFLYSQENTKSRLIKSRSVNNAMPIFQHVSCFYSNALVLFRYQENATVDNYLMEIMRLVHKKIQLK